MRALVLGGGFAGLSAAIHLALGGAEVTLLEGEPDLGGKAGEVVQDGYRFDTGPSVLTLPHVLTGIFERAGERFPLELRPLEPLCRYLYPSGRVWDVFQDVEKTVAQLSSQESRAYRSLLQEARRLYEGAADTFIYNHAPGPIELLKYGVKHGLRAYPGKRLPGLLDRHGASPDLGQFFLRFATYFGADPYRAPAVLHNIAWVELGLGVVYPVGGVKGVVRALAELAARLGIRICNRTRVERLETRGARLVRVHTDRGVYATDMVVSSLDIIRTRQLLGKTPKFERLEPSLSGFVMLLGVEGKTPQLAHHTVSFSANYPAEFAAIRRGLPPKDPTLYLAVSSKSEPGRAPKGHENWFVMANAPALGPGFDWSRGGPGYAEHLMEVLERRGFDVRARVRLSRRLSPQDLAALGHRGSIYGVAPHSLRRTIRPRQVLSGIDNLVLAGGSVHPGGGIPLALLSGKYAAELALKRLA